MDNHPLEFLEGEPREEIEVVEAPPAPEPEPASQAEPAPEPEPEPAPVSPGHVPISALLDEREQRQKAQREAQDLRDWKAAQQQAAAQPLAPDEQFQAALYQQNLRVSRRFAEREYGPELIATVHDWAVARCDADPFFNAQMRSSDDPYGAAYQAYNREQIAAKVTPERLAAFEAWEQAQAQLQAQQPNPTPAASAPVPRSLVTAPGNGAAGAAHVPVGPGEAFMAAISR
ncbi:MAG TPA: hypothetical protein VGF33_03475 [Caulobacteraceae bacterium]|jgi:hypothetical protein